MTWAGTGPGSRGAPCLEGSEPPHPAGVARRCEVLAWCAFGSRVPRYRTAFLLPVDLLLSAPTPLSLVVPLKRHQRLVGPTYPLIPLRNSTFEFERKKRTEFDRRSTRPPGALNYQLRTFVFPRQAPTHGFRLLPASGHHMHTERVHPNKALDGCGRRGGAVVLGVSPGRPGGASRPQLPPNFCGCGDATGRALQALYCNLSAARPPGSDRVLRCGRGPAPHLLGPRSDASQCTNTDFREAQGMIICSTQPSESRAGPSCPRPVDARAAGQRAS